MDMIALFYILPVMFIISFAIYTKWQIIDEDDGSGWTKADTKWHRAGLFMRACFLLAMTGWVFPVNAHGTDLLLLMPIMAITWDMSINYLRGRPFLDVGVGGWDAKIGKKKWLFYGIWLVIIIIIYVYTHIHAVEEDNVRESVRALV